MANNTLLASDSFTSGSLATGWTAISGNTLPTVVLGSPNVTEPSALSTNSGIYWSGLTWPNDHTSEFTINTLTAEANTYATLFVRYNTSTTAFYQCWLTNGTATLYYYNGSTNTSLATAAFTAVLGDVFSLQAAGSVISLYQNGNRVLYAGDANLTGGYPGYWQYSSVSVAHTKVSSWRGYSAVQQDGIWQKQGIVLAPTTADLSGFGVYEAACIYDTNPQVLTQYNNVYKLWFSGGSSGSQSIYYAESPDLVNWTRYGSAVISNFVTPGVIKFGSTYYLYCQAQNAQGTGNVAYYTSPDGITWTQQSTNVLSIGTGGAWDAAAFYPLKPMAVINGTWYALYGGHASGGFFYTGLATSTDGAGAVWTKYSGNPVIIPPQGGLYSFQCVTQVGSTYYVWFQKFPSSPQFSGTGDLADPNDIVRYSTTNFETWTGPVRSMHHTQMFEALNTPVNNTEPVGGIGPVAIFNINGVAKMLYLGSHGDATGPPDAQFSLATAPSTIANIVTGNEDAVTQLVTDNFTSGTGNLDSNWTTLAGESALKIVTGNKCEPSVATSTTCAALYTGATFSGSQYAEITIATLNATTAVASMCINGNATSGTAYYVTAMSGGATLTNVTTGGGGLQGTPAVGLTIEVGDVLRLASVQTTQGTVISLYQNGSLISQVTDTTSSALTSGYPGIFQKEAASGGSQISLFAAGNTNVIPAYVTSNSNNLLLATNNVQVSNGLTPSSNLLLVPNLLGGTNDWS